MTVKPRPTPPPGEQDRIKATERRDRILHDCWDADAAEALGTMFAKELRQYLPPPDTSCNPGISLSLQVAVLYEEPPTVATMSELPLDVLGLERLWALGPRLDLWVVWLQEALIRLDPVQGRPPRARLVSPATIYAAEADPDDPTRPVYLEELRWRDSRNEWTVEAWDIRDPQAPRLTVWAYRSDGPRVDATAEYVTDLPESGWPEWARRANGRPVLPYVLHHRTVGSSLWDWRTGWGLVTGTLESAARWTSWGALARDCSFGIKSLIDGEVVGAGVENGAQAVKISGMSLLQIRSTDGRSAQFQTLPASANPAEMAMAYESRDAALAEHIGLTAADVHRGSTVQSGYALVVSREGQRRAIRRRIPAASEGDRQTLALWSTIYNRMNGTDYPEDESEWSISYPAIALTPAERAERLAVMRAEVEMGIRDPLDLIMERTGLDREAALEEALRIRRTREMLEGREPVQPDPSDVETDEDDTTQEPTNAR